MKSSYKTPYIRMPEIIPSQRKHEPEVDIPVDNGIPIPPGDPVSQPNRLPGKDSGQITQYVML